MTGTMPIDLILSRLPDAKPAGKGKWTARCRAHEDKRPSLSIGVGDDGTVLLKCHAGCSTAAVVEAIGLTMKDLFPPRDNGTSNGKSGKVWPTWTEAVKALEYYRGPASSKWTYHDLAGNVVGVACRWNLPDGSKDFLPVTRNGAGWKSAHMPAPRPLYRLPELLASTGTVYVVEGEKCVDALVALGLTSTTSSGGSKAAGKSDWSPLAGRDVVRIPDNDRPGEGYVADVAAELAKLSPPANVKIVRLPGLDDGEDVFDLIQRQREDGHDDPEIVAYLVALAARVEFETGPIPVYTTPEFPGNSEVVSTVDTSPFPLDALPDPVRDNVDASAAAIGCDPSYVALPTLTVLAGAIGNTRRIQLKRGWTEPAIIWSGIVGESGTQKSPGLDNAREFPRRRQREVMKRHAMTINENQIEKLRYDVELLVWKRKGAKGDPPDEPAQPTLARCLVDDTTIEALAPILLDNWRGTLVFRDELAGWLGAFDRYAKSGRAGGEVSKWIEMHGGRSITIDRKTGTPRTIYVPRAAVSVAGGIQPGILRRLIGQEHRDNGLLARLLMAWPARRPRRWTEAEPAKELRENLQRVYDQLWELSPAHEDGDPAPVLIRLDAKAKSLFVEFVNDHGQEQYQLDGDLAAAWSKLEGYAARLALIHHLVRWVGDPTIDHDHVDEVSMQAGITLVRWFANEDRRIYSALEETAKDTDHRELMDLIRRRGGTITVRQLQQASRRYPTADAAEAALTGLVTAEVGTAEVGTWQTLPPSPNGGPATRVFKMS